MRLKSLEFPEKKPALNAGLVYFLESILTDGIAVNAVMLK